MRHHIPFTRRAGAALLTLFAAGCLSGTDPGAASNPATETFAASLGVNLSQMTKVSNDLYYQDLVVGTGTAVATGKSVNVTYTGWFVNGTQFDSNVGGSPFPFIVGVGAVIPGWDLGLPGMKAGGKRRLVIGSSLGYGQSGYLSIPPNTTLVFDVQVISAQ